MTLIPVHNLLLLPNMPAGMDWSVIGHFAMTARKSARPLEEPIQVAELDCGHHVVLDGRHRFFGHVIGGRTHIEANLE